jgi:hypothetical protein
MPCSGSNIVLTWKKWVITVVLPVRINHYTDHTGQLINSLCGQARCEKSLPHFLHLFTGTCYYEKENFIN